MGKLSTEDIKKMLNCIKRDPRVIVLPQYGFDSGVHVLNDDEWLVVSTDPCIGVPEEWFGWLLINYVASDIALFGAKTEFCTINFLGSPSTETEVFQRVMKQTCVAAEELDIAIVTGHTGRYYGISTIVGVCTGYGHISKDRLITPRDAKPGDCILCVKPIGLETTVNFAIVHDGLAEELFGVLRAKELSKLVPMQSCVKEALALARIEGVHAMHDATEGGIVAALNEMATASNVGFVVEQENFLIPEEAHLLKKFYKLSDTQMLSMSSTGTVLAAVNRDAVNEVEAVLSQIGVEGRFLGCFTENLRRILVKSGEETLFPSEANDPYTRICSQNL